MLVSYRVESPQTINSVAYTYIVFRNIGRRLASVTVEGKNPQTFKVRQGETVVLSGSDSQTEKLTIAFAGLTDRMLEIIAVDSPLVPASILDAKNGLSLDGQAVVLGGDLDRDTLIKGLGFNLTASGVGALDMGANSFSLVAAGNGVVGAAKLAVDIPSKITPNGVLTVVDNSTGEVEFLDPNGLITLPVQGASNGLSLSGTDVILGGTLVQNTIIVGDGTQDFVLEDLSNVSVSAGASYNLNSPAINITTSTATKNFQEVTEIETSLTVDVAGSTPTAVAVVNVAPGQVVTLETDIHYLRNGEPGTAYVKRYESARRPSGGGAVQLIGDNDIVSQNDFSRRVARAAFSSITNATQHILRIDNNNAATGRYKLKLRLLVSEIPDTF